MTPTKAATKAAETIYSYVANTEQLAAQGHVTRAAKYCADLAAIIDRETTFSDLALACRRWLALRERCNAPGAGWSRVDRELEDGIEAEIEAAIAAAEAK